jgi:hypothetical protein
MTPTQPTQPDRPQYPLDDLALFTVFASQADYQLKTGKTPPAFDPTQPVKNWADVNAATDPYIGPGQIIGAYILYPANTAQLAPIILPRTVAATVNMAPTGWNGGTTLKGTPLPLRPLLQNEQLVNTLFGGWMVKRTDVAQPETTDQQFADVKATLAAMQAMLAAISTKVGA